MELGQQGVRLLRVDGTHVPGKEILETRTFIALYFSAHWCPPCRQFTPLLARAYSAADSHRGEIVFISSDRSESEMISYMRESHGSWFALEYNSDLRSTITSKYNIRGGIPALVVVSTVDGSIISSEGRSEIIAKGATAFFHWDTQSRAVDVSLAEMLQKENPESQFREASDILLRLMSNVLRDPQNIKYRSIRVTNPKIMSGLLKANGAYDILFSIGFEEGGDDDILILPLAVSLGPLKAFKNKIEDMRKKKIPEETEEFLVKSSMQQEQFFAKIRSQMELVKQYEDAILQSLALSLIPKEEIEYKAKSTMPDLADSSDQLQDFILYELMAWFKNDFFEWIDAPFCCEGSTSQSEGQVSPTSKEYDDGASRVELYRCGICQKQLRFPRYHSKPAKLLETRRGRCGEWANCFALMCRSMGFETRYIADWTDHAWVEIFSSHKKRWLHADPCENIIDKPLIYEVGWKKNLTYVIATSIEEVQDVTWRYSIKHDEVRKRRTLVDQSWLVSILLSFSEELQITFSEKRKKLVLERRLIELVELLNAGNRKIEEGLSGRQSGSVAWRTARGEIQDSSMVWKPSNRELEQTRFTLSYDAVKDIYYHDDEDIVRGWNRGVKYAKNIIRKKEQDWKMVYLARSEIVWELSLEDTLYCVKSIELKVSSATFENGRIVWKLCGKDLCLLPFPATTLQTDQLSGAKKIQLSAYMSGGKGDVAWQHTQLFRTSLNEDKVGFLLQVTLQKETL